MAEKPKHNLKGNCWSVNCNCSLCHAHKLPRGHCTLCPKCPACEEVKRGE
jgi:hypothetical protein